MEDRLAVYRLPVELRSVLFLRICDRLSFDTIGKLMDLSPSEATQTYARARRRLREFLPSSQ
jgi:DNA-directed RNA polymerase specialized sigma24 family protein